MECILLTLKRMMHRFIQRKLYFPNNSKLVFSFLFAMNIGLAFSQPNSFFSAGVNSGIGFMSKNYEPDTVCNPFTGGGCTDKYYLMKREFANHIYLQYNFKINKLASTKFFVGSGIYFYRTRFGLNPKYESEFYLLHPEIRTDSIIRWTKSMSLLLGVYQEIIPDKFDFLLNLTTQFTSNIKGRDYANGELLNQWRIKAGGIFHVQTGFEFHLSDRQSLNLIWDAPMFFSSGYKSYKWIFMAGYRFSFKK